MWAVLTAAGVSWYLLSSPRLLDAKALGELLGVPPTWLLAQARKDGVPHLRLGKYVRFDPADFENWIKSQKRGAK